MWKKLKTKSLRTKILMTMITALIVGLILSSIITIRLEQAHLINHFTTYQRSILQTVKNTIMLAMIRNQREEILQTLEDLSEQTDIISLKIIASDGVISFSNIAEEIGSKYLKEIPGKDQAEFSFRKELDDGRHIITNVIRIENQPRCHQCHGNQDQYIGFLAIENDISWIERSIIIDSARNIIIALCIFLLMAIAIRFVHIRLVQQSLGKMLKTITQVEKGDFETHVNIQSTDEMGQLAGSFNNMIDRLNEMKLELKQAHKKQLERVDKLANVGELAAGMAHEIKNPIAGISSAMQVILDEIGNEDIRRPIFEEILRQSRRVDSAVNSLLSYARPRTPKFIPTDLTNIIDRALELTRQQAVTSQVEIETFVKGDIPLMVIDPIQIEQVMVNLLLNAIQAMPDGGKLNVIQSFVEEKEVHIKVQDTGIGIDEETQKSIFKPFFTKKYKGTGLGLAISRGIIQRHSGTIEVDSTPGKGSTFTLILPVGVHHNIEKEVV